MKKWNDCVWTRIPGMVLVLILGLAMIGSTHVAVASQEGEIDLIQPEEKPDRTVSYQEAKKAIVNTGKDYFRKCHPGILIEPFILEPVDDESDQDNQQKLEQLNNSCKAIFDTHESNARGWIMSYPAIHFSDLELTTKQLALDPTLRHEPVVRTIKTWQNTSRKDLINIAKDLRKRGVNVEVTAITTNDKLVSGQSTKREGVYYLADEDHEYTPDLSVAYTLRVPVEEYAQILEQEFVQFNERLYNQQWYNKVESEVAITERQNEIIRLTRFVTLLQPYEDDRVNQQVVSVLSHLLADDLQVPGHASILHINTLGIPSTALYNHYRKSANAMTDDLSLANWLMSASSIRALKLVMYD